MKRSPLRRTGRLHRRTRLRPVSRKRAKQDRMVNDLDAFAAEFIGGPCWFCGQPATDIDHIWGRNSRERHARANLGAVCRTCHSVKVTTPETMARYRLKKQLYDPDGYDAGAWTRLARAFGGWAA